MRKKYLTGIGILGVAATIGFSGMAFSSSDEVVSKKNANETDLEIIQHDEIQAQLLSYNFEESVKEADLIVKLKIKDVVGESHPEGGVPKTIFNSEILKTYKSDNKAKDNIKILQEGTKDVVFNKQELYKDGEELILFLKQAVGEEFENTYWSIGSYGTAYLVKNKEVIKQGFKDKTLENIETNVVNDKEAKTNANELHSNSGAAKQHFKEDTFGKKIEQEVKKLEKN